MQQQALVQSLIYVYNFCETWGMFTDMQMARRTPEGTVLLADGEVSAQRAREKSLWGGSFASLELQEASEEWQHESVSNIHFSQSGMIPG